MLINCRIIFLASCNKPLFFFRNILCDIKVKKMLLLLLSYLNLVTNFTAFDFGMVKNGSY